MPIRECVKARGFSYLQGESLSFHSVCLHIVVIEICNHDNSCSDMQWDCSQETLTTARSIQHSPEAVKSMFNQSLYGPFANSRYPDTTFFVSLFSPLHMKLYQTPKTALSKSLTMSHQYWSQNINFRYLCKKGVEWRSK